MQVMNPIAQMSTQQIKIKKQQKKLIKKNRRKWQEKKKKMKKNRNCCDANKNDNDFYFKIRTPIIIFYLKTGLYPIIFQQFY